MSITEENLMNQGIEKINLSVRAHNCLKNNGVDTIAEMIILKEDDLLQFKNLGIKTLNEIITIINRINQNNFSDIKASKEVSLSKDKYSNLVEWVFNKKISSNEIIFYNLNGEIVDDLFINEMGLSVRSYNCLNNNNIMKLSDLVFLDIKTFLDIRNLGQKSINEILQLIKRVVKFVDFSSERNRNIEILTRDFRCDEYKEDIYQISGYTAAYLQGWQASLNNTITINEQNRQKILCDMLQNAYFEDLFKSHILNLLKKYKNADKSDLKAIFPNDLSIFMDSQIELNINNKAIELINGRFQIRYNSFEEYIDSNTFRDERFKTCIRQRAKGKTLEEIGQELGITRERVRQIISKNMRNRPKLKEDEYILIYEKYSFNLKELKYILKLNEYSFVYLDFIARKRGEFPVSEIIYDNELNFPTNKSGLNT